MYTKCNDSSKLQRHIQETYYIWRCLQHHSSLYDKGSLGSAMTSIKTGGTNGLVINQVNISDTIQIILTKFEVTVIRLPLILFLNISKLKEILISIGIMLQTFDTKYLIEFKPNFVVLAVSLKKSV